MSLLPGDPVALSATASGYETSASYILQAAKDLRSLSAAGSSKALEGIREKSVETAGQLDGAHARYSGTATALQTYSVALRAAQLKADQADELRARAQSEARSADERSGELRRRYETLKSSDASVVSVEAAQEAWLDAGRTVRQLETSASDATATIEQARQDVDTAAQDAIRAIDSAMRASKDSAWDKVKKFFGDVGDFLASVAKWVGEVLAKAVEAIVAVLKVVAAALLVIVAILLVIAAIVAILHVLTMIITSAVFWIIMAAAAAIVSSIFVWEFTRDDLDIRVLDDGSSLRSDEQRRAFEQALKSGRDEIASVQDAARAMRFVDKIGGDQTAALDIKRMEGDPPRWVVTLPSTQDLMGSAPNDWPHNVPLKFWPPEMLTKYEQAVLQAMRNAGIGPNDQVMVQGFSQGGIMAARIAANGTSGFNVTGVLTVGSPVHDFDIPKTSSGGQAVHVLTVQHQSDPVPMLQNPLARKDGAHPNWHSFTEPDPPGAHFFGAHTGDGTATNYLRTLDAVVTRNPELSAGDDAPFAHFYGTPQEHTLVSLTE